MYTLERGRLTALLRFRCSLEIKVRHGIMYQGLIGAGLGWLERGEAQPVRKWKPRGSWHELSFSLLIICAAGF
jgi:hypothetical protein